MAFKVPFPPSTFVQACFLNFVSGRFVSRIVGECWQGGLERDPVVPTFNRLGSLAFIAACSDVLVVAIICNLEPCPIATGAVCSLQTVQSKMIGGCGIRQLSLVNDFPEFETVRILLMRPHLLHSTSMQSMNQVSSTPEGCR